MENGNKLREIRISKNLSISQLARKVEVSERFIRFIESGDKYPSLKVAQKIAEELDSKVDDIFLN